MAFLISTVLALTTAILPPGTSSPYRLAVDTTRSLAAPSTLAFPGTVVNLAWDGGRGLVLRSDSSSRWVSLQGDSLVWGPSIGRGVGEMRAIVTASTAWTARSSRTGVWSLVAWDAQSQGLVDSIALSGQGAPTIFPSPTGGAVVQEGMALSRFEVRGRAIRRTGQENLTSGETLVGVRGDTALKLLSTGRGFLRLSIDSATFGQVVDLGALEGNPIVASLHPTSLGLVAIAAGAPGASRYQFLRAGTPGAQSMSVGLVDPGFVGFTRLFADEEYLIAHNPWEEGSQSALRFHRPTGPGVPDSVAAFLPRSMHRAVAVAPGNALVLLVGSSWSSASLQVVRWTRLARRDPEVVGYALDDGGKLPRWWVSGLAGAGASAPIQKIDGRILSGGEASTTFLADSATGIPATSTPGDSQWVRAARPGGIVMDWLVVRGPGSSTGISTRPVQRGSWLEWRHGAPALRGAPGARFRVHDLGGSLVARGILDREGSAVLGRSGALRIVRVGEHALRIPPSP